MSVPEIPVSELETHLGNGAPLFDVRQPDEYAAARVPGAVLVPLGEVADSLHRFPADRTVYVICRSGARSMRAAEFLRANGVEAVNVEGGTMAWVTSGRAYDTDAPSA